MKRFIVSIVCVTVFCVGLGALVEKVGASFKSDERALALVKQARLAIGGEPAIADIRSMIIKGSTSVTFKVDGAARTEQGETEIAMQLPDKLSKIVKIGRHDGTEGEKIVSRAHDVIILKKDGLGEGHGEGTGEGKRVVIRKIEGDGTSGEVQKIIAEGKSGEWTTSDGKKVVIRKAGEPGVEDIIVHANGEKGKRIMVEAGEHRGGMRQNELLRTTLSLLLTPPEGMDVSFTYVGEGDVDGTPSNIVNAEFAGSNIRLYLSKASSLPVMISYQGHAMPRVMMFKTKAPEGSEPNADKMVFSHKMEALEMAEVQVRFSDYRGVNGVQLPFKWTTSVGGQTTEVFDVANYEVNPANISEKFQNRKVLVRTKNDVQ